MPHPNETALRDAYAIFAKGDMEGFLACCTDDVTFKVPGDNRGTGTYGKATFMNLIGVVMEVSQGTFREDVLDVYANDERGVLLLLHSFDRADTGHQEYRTCHQVELRDGKISAWEEWPGDMERFDTAWA
jgi:ketosteroid isomerase-like protein